VTVGQYNGTGESSGRRDNKLEKGANSERPLIEGRDAKRQLRGWTIVMNWKMQMQGNWK
jgi:hypothetical protein